jgi:hypothetical protein
MTLHQSYFPRCPRRSKSPARIRLSGFFSTQQVPVRPCTSAKNGGKIGAYAESQDLMRPNTHRTKSEASETPMTLAEHTRHTAVFLCWAIVANEREPMR